MKSIKSVILVGTFCLLSLSAYAYDEIHVELDEVMIRKDTSNNASIIGKLSKGTTVAIKPIEDATWYYLKDGGVVRKNYAALVDPKKANTSKVTQSTNASIYGIMQESIWAKKEDFTQLPLIKGDRVLVEDTLEDAYKVNFYGQIVYVPKESIFLERIDFSPKELIAYAMQFIGNPYELGGNSLVNGTDCSGFTRLVYENFGVKIQRTSSAQYVQNGVFIDIKDITPGDLVFYGQDNVSHVALYIGNNQVIHSSTPKTGICISPINLDLPIKGIKRIL